MNRDPRWYPWSPWVDVWRARDAMWRTIRGCAALRNGVLHYRNAVAGEIARGR